MGLLDWAMDLVGIDQGKKADAKSRKFQWKSLQAQLAYQKEFAQHGLRWRVEDAKAAGLHPLSALGAQGLPAYSPVGVDSGGGATSAALAKGIRSPVMTAAEKAAAQAALEESKSRVAANEAEAAYYNSMAAKNLQDQASQAPFPEANIDVPAALFAPPRLVYEGGSTVGGAELVAPKVNMSRAGTGGGIVAGPANPSMREFNLPGGFPMMLPDANSLGEALEPLSESAMLAWGVYKENVRRYGEEWRRQFIKRYGPNWLSTVLGLNRKNVFRQHPGMKKRVYKKGEFIPYEGY